MCEQIQANKPQGATHYRTDTEYPTYYIVAPNGIFTLPKLVILDVPTQAKHGLKLT